MKGKRSLWKNGVVLLAFLGVILASLFVITNKPTVLGLDLQGGVELNLKGNPTPQVKTIDNADMDRAVDLIRAGCDNLGLSEVEVSRLGKDQVSVSIPAARSLGKATECATKPARLFFYNWEANLLGNAADISEGVSAFSSSDDLVKEVRARWISAGRPPTEGVNRNWINEGAEPTLWQAVVAAGKEKRITDCSTCSSGDKYYLFRDNKERAPLAGPVASVSDLYFAENGQEIAKEGTIIRKVPQGVIVVEEKAVDSTSGKPLPGEEPAYFILQDDTSLSGNELRRPAQEIDPGSNQPNVTFSFTGEGREAFQEVTREIAQYGQARAPGILSAEEASFYSGSFAIVLDGEVVTRPIINFQENPDGIDGRTGAQISGSFTIQEAQDLASYLQRGALPIELVLVSQSQVSATLGQEALEQSTKALLAGLILVIAFLIFFYRFLGVIASLALVSYGIIFLALVNLIPITLTLPGIAGLVLTIGVAADSNIVIFERIKEELRLGKSIRQAISLGYKKGIATIIDANVVTLLTAFVLFLLATSGIKGFAFTLGVGTLVSLLTAVVLTRSLLSLMGENRLMKGKFFLNEGRKPRMFDFAGRARSLFALSGIILILGAGAIAYKGLEFGIDFASGSKVEFAVEKDATSSDIRESLASLGLGDVEIQTVENKALGDNAFQIQSETLKPQEIAAVKEKVNESFTLERSGSGVGETAESFTSVSIGPTFGASIIESAVLAMLLSLLLISGYLALRFQAKYIAPVLIAIMHDILISLGIYALFGFEVSSATVAAFLTILGYSLYDTIIVFDRIRENESKMPRATYSQIINRSTSEVLTRSLITTLSTLLPVLALLLFGGETLQSFALAIFVGLLSGAYSSLFIASPVLAFIKEREPLFRRRRRQQEKSGAVPSFYEDVKIAEEDKD